ncbi:MAG: TRAP transporter large permease [Pyramidobacter sp.]|nr:TRAP transporter large permease [Pyramidobacter sp.]
MASLFLFVSFFALLFLGAPIALCLGASSVMYIYLFMPRLSPLIVAQQMLAGVDKFTLMAVPFFVMAGVLMEFGGISKRIIAFAKSLDGHFTGGLALAVIVASVFFAAMTGSGVAATAAVGGIMIPSMVKSGYDEDFSCALQATAGIFGPLIPPSIAMVLYAIAANQSVGDMLLAGVGPGLLQATLVALLAIWVCRKKGFRGEGHFSFKNVLVNFKESFWALMSPVIILGGIYSGVFTPTEAAAVSCFYSLLVGLFIYKELTFKSMFSVLARAMVSSAGIMFIVAASGAFAWVLTRERIALKATQFFLSLSGGNPYVFLFVAVIILLIAGCFIDSVPIVTIFTPIFAPVAVKFGISLVHFGAIMISSTCVGLITPPVGLNLFMSASIGNRPVHAVIKEIKAFIVVTIIGLLMVTYIPGIATFFVGK